MDVHETSFFKIGAEITGINESWDADSNSNDLEDSIGIMVYEGTQSLNYVKNFVNGVLTEKKTF